MALYVRLQTSFYSHKKTARLRGKLGDDALWLVPRLWAYAAECQPDGDFSSYEAGELAMLLGYNKDACSMLEALQQAGFMDGMAIHDWSEHNGYHEVFADRAKKAASARWKNRDEKKGQDKTRKDKKRKETSIASSMLEASSLVFPGDFSESRKETFTLWAEYKAERKEVYKPLGWKALLTEYQKMSDVDLAAAIQFSMAKGYKGIFADQSQQLPRGMKAQNATTDETGAVFFTGFTSKPV